VGSTAASTIAAITSAAATTADISATGQGHFIGQLYGRPERLGIRTSTEVKTRAGGEDRRSGRPYRRRMSTITAPTSLAGPRDIAVPRGRLGLLFAAILVTSVSGFVLAVVSFAKPIGEGGDALPGYAALAPSRDYVWTFFTVAGVQLVVGAIAAAIATMLLARNRWGTIGGAIVWLGAALYGVGIGGWAAAYYFGSDPELAPNTATALVDRINDDAAHILVVPIAGAVLIGLGTLALAVALWRARTVPRWVPIVGALAAVATIVIPPDTIAGIVSEGASSVTTVAVGWYAWRR